MKAMILAAGLGTRMRPLTDHIPKPMLLVAGKPLIEHHVQRLVKAGVTNIVINHYYLGEQIENYLGDGERFNCHIQYSREEQVLDTGGGIFRALPLLGTDPFIVINSDAWTDYPLQNLFDKLSGHAYLVLTDNPPQATGENIFLQKDSTLNMSGNGTRLTWTGIRVLHPAIFDGCIDGAFPFVPLLKQAMAAGLVSGEYYGGQWLDVGTPERLLEANHFAISNR
ncbi:MAG: Glucose-phosphate thymidylyltransferase [Verrucomicrobiaceae bacterium]|nr:Glucose-phosphate thymidylyltransferase [Verrucomicrobiaceae bacterium]